MKRVVFRVTCEVPDDVSREDIRTFVEDALSTWGGQLHPDDVLFDSLGNVHVIFENRRKTPGAAP